MPSPTLPNPRLGRRRTMQAAAAAAVAAAAGPARAATPFFKMYVMIPNNQPARMIWGTLAAAQMARIGIDVTSSFVPFTVISPRRSKGDGKTHVDGGWDCYLERYYYNAILPTPNSLFHSRLMPPGGQNFYYVDDKQLDEAMDTYGGSPDPKVRMDAIHAFEKRWYDIQPMTILFYPEDVIAVNPKLKGFTGTTFNPVFFPRPERWTIEGAGEGATAAFASWSPPNTLIPMYTIGYTESKHLRPSVQPAVRIRQLGEQEAGPRPGREPHAIRRRQALGDQAAPGRDLAQRRGVHRGRREVHLGHHDEPGLWQPIPRTDHADPGVGRQRQGDGQARDQGGSAGIQRDVLRLAAGRAGDHSDARLQGHQAGSATRAPPPAPGWAPTR